MDTERRRWKVHVYVVGRHHWRGLSIGVCRKGVVETMGERPKEEEKWMCAMDRRLREGEGEEGVCMHERKLVLATKVRGLCGCKRLTKIIIPYESGIIYLKRRS
jgi:hypothetical protein